MRNNPIVKRFYPDNKTFSLENLKKKVIAFDIFYSQLEYTIISEVANLNPLTLIANIGGVLGLCLGMSFLSFVEIFELLIEASSAWLHANWNIGKGSVKNNKIIPKKTDKKIHNIC